MACRHRGSEALAQLLVPIFQHLVVGFGVEAIHGHAGNLIEEILRLDLRPIQALYAVDCCVRIK